jgi:hypothetical protein
MRAARRNGPSATRRSGKPTFGPSTLVSASDGHGSQTFNIGQLLSPSETPAVTKSIVNHVQTSLARQAYNLDKLGAYQATALAVRDDLIVRMAFHLLILHLIFFSSRPAQLEYDSAPLLAQNSQASVLPFSRIPDGPHTRQRSSQPWAQEEH